MIEVAITLALLSIGFDLVAHQVDAAVLWADQLSVLLLSAAAAVLVVETLG